MVSSKIEKRGTLNYSKYVPWGWCPTGMEPWLSASSYVDDAHTSVCVPKTSHFVPFWHGGLICNSGSS